MGKFNGAVGNFNAHSLAYPEVTGESPCALLRPNRRLFESCRPDIIGDAVCFFRIWKSIWLEIYSQEWCLLAPPWWLQVQWPALAQKLVEKLGLTYNPSGEDMRIRE